MSLTFLILFDYELNFLLTSVLAVYIIFYVKFFHCGWFLLVIYWRTDAQLMCQQTNAMFPRDPLTSTQSSYSQSIDRCTIVSLCSFYF